MRRQIFSKLSLIAILFSGFMFNACSQNSTKSNKLKSGNKVMVQSQNRSSKYKVTFIELGSVHCIPCQKMESVMDSIKANYGKQVKVVFHDVWTAEGRPFGEKYDIKLIPTQIFLDENGKEFFRHVGYFPEGELIKILKAKGVTQDY